MKHLFTSKTSASCRLAGVLLALATVTAAEAATISLTVDAIRRQTITGFGAACCDGAMCPYGSDTTPVRLLYGPTSKIGLNIMRMEISPNFVGDVIIPEWGNYDSPYDWNGSLPSAKIVKQRGGIVFGTPCYRLATRRRTCARKHPLPSKSRRRRLPSGCLPIA